MRRLLIAMTTLAVAPTLAVLGLWTPAGQAAPSPATPPTAAANTAPDNTAISGQGGHGEEVRTSTVTLLTGDRVRVTELAGDRYAVDVTPAERQGGGPPSFLTIERDGDLHVIPEDVNSLVPDRLDLALFNVTELVEQGYDDASYDTLPLIVSHGDGRPTSIPAAEVTHRLESIDSAGVQLDKDRADELGTALATLAEATEGGRTTRSAGPLAGFEKIWLDGKVEAALDESVGQVGAPAAWAAGLDGSGVTVAVLDTGIDATHEDLAGKVVGERNFSSTPTPADGRGHGTHVASILAGTGAASNGTYRGVAEGVDLLSGKVLDDNGDGFVSWAIDGMEWAAEQEADIVNMSLGTRDAGGVVMDEAADALTAEHGTLFVVSAGNDGCEGCVSHPATAESAVGVGAVYKTDVLASFSSRGPLPDSYGIKPDVTAPGVGIVAARADGTSLGFPLDDDYSSLDGTSMAAPHVAGLAALLLQAEPSLEPGELKAWLMNSAVPHGDPTVYEQGAGRVDVERALGAGVIATPGSVSFGHFPFPHEGRDPESRTVTYRNLTGGDVVLDLSVEVTTEFGTAPPDGTLTTSSSTVTVPAEGTAAVDIVLDTANGEPGLYGGYLLAEAADGTTLRTPVGYHQEQELVELRLTGIARDGRPAAGTANILNVDDGRVSATRTIGGDPTAPCTEDSWSTSACILLPPGTYSVLGLVETMPTYEQPAFSAIPLNRSLVGDPEIEITEDTEVVLDARKATEVLIDTPDHETKRNLGAAMQITARRAPERGSAVTLSRGMYAGAMLEERLFIQPMDEVTKGEFAAYTRWRLEAPRITLNVTEPADVGLHPKYYRPARFSDFSWQFPMLEGDLETEIVDAGLGRPHDVAEADLDGKVALIQRSDAITVAEQSNNAADAGAKLVAIYNDVPGVNSESGPPTALLQVPTTWISHEEGETVRAMLADGPVRVAAHGVTASEYAFELIYTEEGSVPDELHYVADTDRLARVESPVHSQLADEMTMSTIWFPYQPWETSSFSQPLQLQGGPRTLVTYVTPDPVQWTHTVQTPEPSYSNNFGPYDPVESLRLFTDRRSYQAGELDRHSWYEQPLAPGASPSEPPTRDGDTIELSMGMLDSAGNFGGVSTSWFGGGLDTSFRVYRGEELVGETAFNAQMRLEADPEPTQYRIEYDIANVSPWAALSTRTSSVWTFTTQRPDDGEQRVEPILGVDYDFDVDLRNRAPHPRDRRGPHRIGMTLSHPDGAAQIPVDEVTLEVSYDDGDTWQQVRNIQERGDDHYVATLDNTGSRAGGGFLSVKLSVADEDGNTLRQEIIRAYALPER